MVSFCQWIQQDWVKPFVGIFTVLHFSYMICGLIFFIKGIFLWYYLKSDYGADYLEAVRLHSSDTSLYETLSLLVQIYLALTSIYVIGCTLMCILYRRITTFLIDAYVVNAIDDVSLSKYLPLYGDRVALYNYCKEGTNKKKKPGLFEKLKQKMNLKSTVEESKQTEENCAENRINARKGDRLIQIGWIHRTSGSKFTQVRATDGGGARKVSIEKEAVKGDILKIAKEKFFPEGVSSKGPENNFVFDVWDFARNKMPENVSVGKMYETTGLSQLRYYLYTEENEIKSKGKKLVKTKNESNCEEEILFSDFSDDDLPEFCSPRKIKAVRENIEYKTQNSTNIASSSTSQKVEDASIPPADILRMAAIEAEIINDDDDIEIHFGPLLNRSPISLDETLPTNHQRSEHTIYQRDEVGLQTSNTAVPLNLMECLQNFEEVQSHREVVRVHRGQVFEDLIAYFGKTNIDPNNQFVTVEMMLPNGKLEAAEDCGGVMRDCLSEFWKSFYERCTTGGTNKIPYLRHDFDDKRWEAVGKIIVTGWRQEGYFPIEMSKAFMQQCLYRSTTESLVDSFLNIVSTTDKEVLQLAMKDFNEINIEELLDILDNYDCKSLPTAKNFTEIINQLAHKAIIQEPNFVIDAWYSVFNTVMSKDLSKEKLDSMYNDLAPTPKKVVNIIDYPKDMNVAENTVSKHLQRFIKDLDKQNLSAFLRFVTGSDLLVRNKITVSFVDLQGLARRPVGRTCGCILELPRIYSNYPDFKSEFLSVLQSSVWVMDII